MTRLRALSGCLALVATVAACGDDPSNSAAAVPTVANVGALPVQDGAPLLGIGGGGAAVGAAPAAAEVTSPPRTTTTVARRGSTTTSPSRTTTTAPRRTTTTIAVPSSIAEALANTDDPDRRAWLQDAAKAGADTYAGGADAAELVEGNRVLVIGDSILASTASRYGGEACKQLVPEGWAVEVNAETGRFIDFGERVIESRLDDDFDAAVVMLGNNYGANREVFEDGLREIVEELAPRPTVLFSVTMFEPNRADVNSAVYDIASDFDNVRVVDWAGETEEDPALLGGDGLHLSDSGRERLIELVTQELGEAPDGEDEGDCLSSDFTDDSATSPTGTTLPGQAPFPGDDDDDDGNTGGGNGGGGGGGGVTTTVSGGGGTPGTDPPSEPEPTSPPATQAPPQTTVAPPVDPPDPPVDPPVDPPEGGG